MSREYEDTAVTIFGIRKEPGQARLDLGFRCPIIRQQPDVIGPESLKADQQVAPLVHVIDAARQGLFQPAVVGNSNNKGAIHARVPRMSG